MEVAPVLVKALRILKMITGRLLFGKSSGVYDVNGDKMPGSVGILAHPSSTEIVISRKPLSKNLFYIIYNNQLCSSLYYSVVDLSERNGLGDVVELNVPLDNVAQYAEGLEVIGVPCSNNFLLIDISAIPVCKLNYV